MLKTLCLALIVIQNYLGAVNQENPFAIIYKEKIYIKKAARYAYRKIRFKKDKKVIKLLNKIFAYDMRNLDDAFKKRLSKRIKKGQSIQINKKLELCAA